MGLLEPICAGMWSLTPYDKCDFRCLYCCTRVQGVSRPSVPAAELLPALRGRLDAVPHEDLVIVGAFSDAYPQVETDLGLTRPVIEELLRQRRRFVIVTKGRTVLRDADLLLTGEAPCKVQISICSVNDDVLRRLDPGAPSGTDRFTLLRELHDLGVTVDLLILPWIPGVSETPELIARVPRDVEIVLAPLAFGPDRDSMTLLGRRYARDEVNASYLEAYRRHGHVRNTSWVRPSPPPEENNPVYRLPVLPA